MQLHKFKSGHATIGHNQGPPLLDKLWVAEIAAAVFKAVRDTEQAVDLGSVAKMVDGKTALANVSGMLGKGFLEGVGRQVGARLVDCLLVVGLAAAVALWVHIEQAIDTLERFSNAYPTFFGP